MGPGTPLGVISSRNRQPAFSMEAEVRMSLQQPDRAAAAAAAAPPGKRGAAKAKEKESESEKPVAAKHRRARVDFVFLRDLFRLLWIATVDQPRDCPRCSRWLHRALPLLLVASVQLYNYMGFLVARSLPSPSLVIPPSCDPSPSLVIPPPAILRPPL